MKDFAHPENPKVIRYLRETFQPEDAILAEIRESIKESGMPQISVGDFDGLHLEVLARMQGAKKIVEIGTLGGYSGVCFARALPEDGKLYTFEISKKHAEVAKKAFELAKVDHKVEILVGPALEKLPEIEKHGPFDLVFIDADKNNYPNYMNWATEHLRVGGAVLGDNTFGFGKIGDESFESEESKKTVENIRRFNGELAQNGRFRATMIPTGEGLTLAVKIK